MKIFSPNAGSNAINIWLLISRVTVSAIMLTHGLPKLQHVLAGNMQFADPIGIGSTLSLVLVTFAEALCSVLLIIGLATRLAAIPLIINMVVVVFIAMGSEPFAKKELAVFYLIFYIGFLILGGGKYSLDYLISKKSRRRY